MDKIDSSIKSIRSAIAQTKITQEKLDIKNREKVFFAPKDQGRIDINLKSYFSCILRIVLLVFEV